MDWKKILGDIKEKAFDYAEKVKEEREIKNNAQLDEKLYKLIAK